MAFIDIHSFRKYEHIVEKSFVRRLKIMEACFGEINDTINNRGWLYDAVERYQVNGKVVLVVDSTDCDLTRGHDEWLMDADPRLITKEMHRMYADREGPMHFRIRQPKGE